MTPEQERPWTIAEEIDTNAPHDTQRAALTALVKLAAHQGIDLEALQPVATQHGAHGFLGYVTGQLEINQRRATLDSANDLSSVNRFIPISEFYDNTQSPMTKAEIVSDLMEGQYDDAKQIVCVSGPMAGTDATDLIRDECLEAADFDGSWHPPFLKAHEGYGDAESKDREAWEAERRHQQQERTS